MGEATAQPPYDATTGRVARWVRLVVLAFLALFTLEQRRRTGGTELGMLVGGGLLLTASNLVSWAAARRPDHPWARRAVVVELALDSVYAISDAALAIPIIGYAALGVPALVVPLEAAFRRGLRGGLATAGVISVGVIGGRLLAPDLFLMGPLQGADVAPVLVAPALLAVTLGSAVRARQRAVDDLAAANAELHDALRWQQELLSFAAHEVKTPLTSTVGALALVNELEGLPEDRRLELLEMAQRSALRAAATADDMLGRARVAAGALTPTLQPVDVTALVEEACATARTAGLDLRCDLAPGVVVASDPTFLRHVVSNLLSNAEKYGEPPVELELSRTPRGLRLRVTDHGPGVPPEFVPRMFDSFTRAEGATAEGTGVGLHVVRRMVRALGGEVSYAPSAAGGAQLTVDLTASPAEVRRDGSGPEDT